MKNFPIRECPLCGQVLKFRTMSGVSVYDCPTQFEFLAVGNQKHNKSHYEVEFDKVMSVQHVVVLPYGVDTYTDSTTKVPRSRILKYFPQEIEAGGGWKWRFIREVPQIYITAEAELLERLGRLMPFA